MDVQEQQLEVTPVNEWRKDREEGILVELPSGRVARLRPVKLDDLIRSNAIPDRLSGLITAMFSSDKKIDLETWENIENFHVTMDVMTVAAMMEPKVVMTEEELISAPSTILISDVPYIDKTRMVEWVQESTYALDSFREESEGDVELVPDGDEVSDEAIDPDGSD